MTSSDTALLTGNRFRIQSSDGKTLYAGTVRVDSSAKPGHRVRAHGREPEGRRGRESTPSMANPDVLITFRRTKS